MKFRASLLSLNSSKWAVLRAQTLPEPTRISKTRTRKQCSSTSTHLITWRWRWLWTLDTRRHLLSGSTASSGTPLLGQTSFSFPTQFSLPSTNIIQHNKQWPLPRQLLNLTGSSELIFPLIFPHRIAILFLSDPYQFSAK